MLPNIKGCFLEWTEYVPSHVLPGDGVFKVAGITRWALKHDLSQSSRRPQNVVERIEALWLVVL